VSIVSFNLTATNFSEQLFMTLGNSCHITIYSLGCTCFS